MSANYFESSDRRVSQDPALEKITWYRRYGFDECYEFYCKFANVKKLVWVKWKDVKYNATYMAYLDKYNWRIAEKVDEYLDDIPNTDDDDPHSDTEPIFGSALEERKVKNDQKNKKKMAGAHYKRHQFSAQNSIVALIEAEKAAILAKHK